MQKPSVSKKSRARNRISWMRFFVGFIRPCSRICDQFLDLRYKIPLRRAIPTNSSSTVQFFLRDRWSAREGKRRGVEIMGAVSYLICKRTNSHAPLTPCLCYWTRPNLRRITFTAATSKKFNCSKYQVNTAHAYVLEWDVVLYCS